MSVWSEIGVVVALSVSNGVFTSAEAALLSVRKTRLQELADDGHRGARAALALRETPEVLLATVQIGVTVIGATTAIFGGARLAEPLERGLRTMGVHEGASAIALAGVVAFVSYLSLVLGELVPKSLAIRTPERFALALARPLLALASLAKPLVSLLTASSNAVLRPFDDETTFTESKLSPDELQQLVEEAATSGALDTRTGEIASRALDFARLKANALMVPRVRIVALEVNATAEEVLETMRLTPHARYPVYENDLEQILGYVLSREIYGQLLAGALDLRALVRPVPFFPDTTRAVDILRAAQAAKRQLVLLVDEQGGLEGLITLEDIVEDLFGEIAEEYETVRPLVWREPSTGEIFAFGDAPLHEVGRVLEHELPNETRATTLSGLLAERLGRVPAAGERVQVTPELEVEVLEATPRRVTKLRLHFLHDPRTYGA